ncbi:MAG: glutathione S-transferase N-terminal domain-containing protein [Pseudomonadota bacterium]
MLLKALRNGLGQLIVLGDTLTRPTPLQRTPERQAEVEQALTGLSLYQFRACPFCVKVRRNLHRLNLPITLRDAANDPTHRRALAEGGGEIKVPCLRITDGEQDTWLYESDEIIAYLDTRFS